MDKKFLLVFLLVGMFCFSATLVSAEECPWYNPSGFWVECGDTVNYSNSVGYALIDNGDVIYIWNNATVSDYFFDVDSGIQLTNHHEDYWTKNTFCIGYYTGEDWNQIKCSDELSGFNKNIHTDNETYVNATLWKDITYQGYDLRLGVQYYLGLNDEDLSITIYGKNLGDDIPFDLGFAWKISDWEIPHEGVGGDSIFINNTDYRLDGTYDLTFKNMSHSYYDEEINQTVTEYDSYFRAYDYTEFLRVDWDKNLDYAVRMVGNGNQEDFYISTLINAGHFNSGQEKSTTFNWVDAKGDYTGFSFDISGSGNANPIGITSNGTYLWTVDNFDDGVYKYWMNGTYTGDFFNTTGSGNAAPYGITNDGIYFWITDAGDAEVYQYWMNGTYTDFSFDTSGSGNTAAYGITNDGIYFWTTDLSDDEVYQYWMNGTYTGFSFNTTANDIPYSLTSNGTYIWVTDTVNDEVYQYWMNGTYTGFSFDTAGSGNEVPTGITNNGTYFWTVDSSAKKVYQYELYLPHADTCTYTSGTWEVDCADNCSITSDVDLDGNNITILGSGVFDIAANITNFMYGRSQGTNETSVCAVTCRDGGCLRF